MWKLARPVLRLALLAAALVVGGASPRADELHVAVSIKPLHSVVAGVMAGLGSPELVVPSTATPQTYVLKPADARRLTGARLVFWIGPMYETLLARPLEMLGPSARVVALADVSELEFLPARHGGEWLADEHGGEGAEPRDGHLWLDPMNAAAMAGAIAAALAEADPAHAARYAENAVALRARLAALDRELAATLAPARGVPFIVFRDTYQYLERRYGLNAVGSVAVAPESRPGARRVSALRGKIAGLGARCVITEPQLEPSIARALTTGTKARIAVLDPLGGDLAGGPDLYFALLRRLAGSLRDCLGDAAR
jgi:zinc transport system substrate-binding protein